MAGVGTTPALVTVAPTDPAPRASSLLDPFSRFASIPADDEAQRPDVGPHRTDQRRANARNCGVIERIFARSPADAVCTEEMRHDRDISIGLDR